MTLAKIILILAAAAPAVFAQNPTPGSDTLKKANARPVASPTPKVEPFGGASVERYRLAAGRRKGHRDQKQNGNQPRARETNHSCPPSHPDARSPARPGRISTVASLTEKLPLQTSLAFDSR